MLKEVTDIKKRCEVAGKIAKEKLSNASTIREKDIQSYVIRVVDDIKIRTTLDIFVEHVRNNLETVKTLKIGTDEANEYIRSIMGDILTVSHVSDKRGDFIGIRVFKRTLACDVVSPGKEWETITEDWKYHRPYEPEEAADIIRAVYEKAEELGRRQTELNIEEEKLMKLHPELLDMIPLVKKSAMLERRRAEESKKTP